MRSAAGTWQCSMPSPPGKVARSENGEGKCCKTLSVTCGDSSPRGRAKGPLLPLPLGEVAERSEDGEGIRCKTLSVTCGDSSPRGGAKGPLSHLRRQLSQRGSQGSSQSSAATALPEGEPFWGLISRRSRLFCRPCGGSCWRDRRRARRPLCRCSRGTSCRRAAARSFRGWGGQAPRRLRRRRA